MEATTFAAISLTLREHSWSLARFLLLFSAFTCKEHGKMDVGAPHDPPMELQGAPGRGKELLA